MSVCQLDGDEPSPISASSTGLTAHSRLDSVNHLDWLAETCSVPITTRFMAAAARHWFRTTLDPRCKNMLLDSSNEGLQNEEEVNNRAKQTIPRDKEENPGVCSIEWVHSALCHGRVTTPRIAEDCTVIHPSLRDVPGQMLDPHPSAIRLRGESGTYLA